MNKPKLIEERIATLEKRVNMLVKYVLELEKEKKENAKEL